MSRSPSPVPVKTKPKSLLGLHMFAVEVLIQDDQICPYTRQYIISLCRMGKLERQFGPVLTDEDKKEIVNLIKCHDLVGGRRMVWHLIELLVLIDDIEMPDEFLELNVREPLRVHQFYEDTPQNREISIRVAEEHSIKRNWHSSSALATKDISTRAFQVPVNVQRMYGREMHLFRLKWLEIQGEIKELEDYTLHKVEEQTQPKTKEEEENDEESPMQTDLWFQGTYIYIKHSLLLG